MWYTMFFTIKIIHQEYNNWPFVNDSYVQLAITDVYESAFDVLVLFAVESS